MLLLRIIVLTVLFASYLWLWFYTNDLNFEYKLLKDQYEDLSKEYYRFRFETEEHFKKLEVKYKCNYISFNKIKKEI